MKEEEVIEEEEDELPFLSWGPQAWTSVPSLQTEVSLTDLSYNPTQHGTNFKRTNQSIATSLVVKFSKPQINFQKIDLFSRCGSSQSRVNSLTNKGVHCLALRLDYLCLCQCVCVVIFKL